MKPVIILSGPIGAGKTTVARELIALSPAPLAYIEGDTFWSYISKVGMEQIGHKEFRMLMRSMTAAALPFAMNDYETLLDFSIPPWFLDTAIKMADFKKIPLHYVVLRPSETICAARAATRAEGVIADYSEYHELYTSFDEAEQYTIHDDTRDASAIATHIRQGLDSGAFRVSS